MDSGSDRPTTILFTDIEGSTRLWEQDPVRMRSALAHHDELCRATVEAHGGAVIKMTGDGVYAAFGDPSDALLATVALQTALSDPAFTEGIELKVRCGLHAGAVERRGNDYFGTVVNRTARIMSIAHGGQVLLSKAVADLVGKDLPSDVAVLDLGIVRLRDLADPERVFQLVHPALRTSFPALRSLEATPNNLPQRVTSFVGREQLLAETKRLLGGTRMLTLLGAGGLGKTSLSLQVAVDVIDDFLDGVWLVELAPLSDGQMVAQAVASSLGVKEEAGRPVQEALETFVKDRQILLILDNCEHVLQSCASVVKSLLACGPRAKVLATSREPLREAGEATLHVPPLRVPDAESVPSFAELAQYDSVRLFCERAAASKSGFALTEQNAPAVAAICQRLDGIPLALELAAARVRSLPVETIAARLSDRFRILATGSRTGLPRQQTLRACIEWSYNLLTPDERTLLRRLAVFAGGFVLEAAESIGAGGEIGESEVLDLLSQLVDKSLVELTAEGHRYRLLETVRQYAFELLERSGEVDATRNRHLAYYLVLTDQAERQMSGPQQGEWLGKLDTERENVLGAHAWCGTEAERGDMGLSLVSGMQLYWMRRGILRLGYRVTVEAIERPGAEARTFARCKALYAAANIGSVMARRREAQAYVEESLAIGRELGSKDRVAAALVLLGTLLSDQGDRANARKCYEESLALSEELGDALRLSNALGSLAVLSGSDGKFDEAEALFERSLALSRKQGNRNNIAANLCNLATVAVRRGACARARISLLEALAIAEDIGARSLGLAILGIAATLEATESHFERAARSYGARRAEGERQGFDANRDDEILMPLIAQARRALGEEAFAEAEAAGYRLAYAEAMAEVRTWMASKR
ncbi:MAG TPA: tetratricopeptide repeat protein [Casimicrobiaceae bacterium]|nr:tetratricopeptide repeat protein [Casimicrobiaceae bacterium]